MAAQAGLFWRILETCYVSPLCRQELESRREAASATSYQTLLW